MRRVPKKLRIDELEPRLMLTITVVEGQVVPPTGFFGPAEVLVNFDNTPNGEALAPGTTIAQQYESWGVEFSPIGGPDSRFVQAGFGSDTDFVSPPNSLAAGHLDVSNNEAVVVEVNFIDEQLEQLPTEVGFVFTDSAPDNPFTVRFYNASNNLVDSVTINTADDSGAGTVVEDTFIGIRGAGGISRFTMNTEFDHAENIFGMEIDDLRFSPGPIRCAVACMYVSDSEGNLGNVDVTSGSVEVIGTMSQVMFDIAFSPAGNLYGVTSDSLYQINTNTAATTLIGNHGIPTANALTFSNDGTLYAMSASATQLFEIDITTGTSTSLGDVGFQSAGDLAFVDGVLYLAASTDELVTITLTPSVSSTVVGTFGVVDVLGLGSPNEDALYGTADTSIYTVNLLTGAAEDVVDYGGQGLLTALGAAFETESIGSGQISGFKFDDQNANGVRDKSLVQGNPPHVVFAVDMSFRVNESLGGTSVGDVNNDGIFNSRLDAEIAAFLALNQELVDSGFGRSASVSIVAFNVVASSYDMDVTSAGKQLATFPTADLNGNGVRDVEELLRTIGRTQVSSNLAAALQESLSVLQTIGAPASNGNVVLTSNGRQVVGAFDDEAQAIRNRGSGLRVTGVGNDVDVDVLRLADPDAATFGTTQDLLGVFSGLVAPTFGFQESGLPGWTIYLDTNGNRLLDSSEPSTVTSSTGHFSFPNLLAGSYVVREVNQPGWIQTAPSTDSSLLGGTMVVLGAGEQQTNVNFGNKRLLTGPEISVFGRAQPILDGAMTATIENGTDFSTLLDRAQARRTFNVRNDGNANLQLSGLSVPDGFAVIDGLVTVLEPGASDPFTIEFTASDTRSGIVSFSTNDTDENPFTFFIQSGTMAPNTPPTISGLPDITLPQNTTRENAIDLPDFANDNETPSEQLAYTILSISDAQAGITINATKGVDIQPATNWIGQSDVTIRVTDPSGAFADDTFRVTVPANCLYHNETFAEDVDGNGLVSPLDPLLVINELIDAVYSDPATGLLDCDVPSVYFLDVNNDGFVSPIDALQAINRLNDNLAASRTTAAKVPEIATEWKPQIRRRYVPFQYLVEYLDRDDDRTQPRLQDYVFASYGSTFSTTR